MYNKNKNKQIIFLKKLFSCERSSVLVVVYDKRKIKKQKSSNSRTVKIFKIKIP